MLHTKNNHNNNADKINNLIKIRLEKQQKQLKQTQQVENHWVLMWRSGKSSGKFLTDFVAIKRMCISERNICGARKFM